MIEDLLGRICEFFSLKKNRTADETRELQIYSLDKELLDDFLHDLEEEVDDEPSHLLGEISDDELEKEVLQDATIQLEGEGDMANHAEAQIIAEIHNDLQLGLVEPHEEILDEIGEADHEEIAGEIAIDLENNQDENSNGMLEELEDKEILEDILEELKEDLEGEDYIPTFESQHLDFEEKEKQGE